MTTIGTAVLQIIPSLQGVSDALDKASKNLTITPRIDTSGATRAGEDAGRQVQAGMDSQASGGLRRFLTFDGARSSGQQAGSEVNAGLQSANIGRGLSSTLGANLLQGAESAGRNLGSLIATGLKSTAIAGGALAATGIGLALHDGFSRLTAIDDAKFKLQGLGNSAQNVQSIMDNALAAVKGTAFGLDEAATTAASAVAAGITPGKQLTDYLKLTADTAAIAGTSLSSMGEIFNKVQTSGKAFTADLDQLSTAGLPVFQWLQDEYKVSGEALTKMVSDGKVDAATFQKVIAEHITGAAQTMGGSIRGQLSNLKASFSRFGAEVAGPIFAAVSPLTIAFTGAFDKITTSIKPFTAQLTAIIGPWATDLGNSITAWLDNGGVQKIVDWFGRLRDTFASLTSGGGAGAFKSISDSIKGIGPALASAGPALASVGQAMGAFGQAIVTIGPQTLTSVLVPSLKVLADALKFVADNASWAIPVIGGLVLTLGGFKAAEQTVAPIFNALNGAFKIINAPIMLAQVAAIRAQTAAFSELSASLGVNTVAAEANAVASEESAVATSGGRIAALASAAASKVAAAAQWLWNAALLANPITLIIAGVVAAGVAIWAFFTKTETGRKLWAEIWSGIKATAETVWNWLKKTFETAWTQLQPGLTKIGTVAREAFSAIGDAVSKVWHFIQPAVDWFGRLYAAVAKLEFHAAIAVLKELGSVIGWLWTNVVVPAFSGIASAISSWWATTKVIWDFAQPAIHAVGDVIMWLWHNVAEPAFSAIGTVISTWWSGVQTIWGLFKTGIEDIGKAVGVVKDAFVTGFNAIKDVVSTVWDFLSGIFDKIKNGVGDIASALSSIPGVGSLFTTVTPPKPPGHAIGGQIRGAGTGTSDSILLRASNGEFIVNADDTRKNLPLLEIINSGKIPPGYAGGGMVGSDVEAAQNLVGTPYSMAKRFDCSGDVARVINAALGQDGGLMTTANAAQWLAARGFKQGIGGPGTISVGWKNGGPGGGHMAMTLSDGRNAEGGGSHPNFMIGGAAAGASSPQFTDHMFLALAGASAPQGATSGQGDKDAESKDARADSTSAKGAGTLPSSFSGLSSFGLDSLGVGEGTTGSGTDLGVFGTAAGSAVSGELSSALGVFGAGDSPPFLNAASKLIGGLKVGGHNGPGKSDGSIFDGSNIFGQGRGGSSAAPLAATSTMTGTAPPDGEVHGTRARQAPGPVVNYNIRTATTEDAFLQARRRENERNAAKLNVY